MSLRNGFKDRFFRYIFILVLKRIWFRIENWSFSAQSLLFLPVMKNEVYILLGSNLGNRQEYLFLARQALSHLVGEIVHTSAMFETAPWGSSADEQLYLNQAVMLSSSFSPATLIRQTLKIERTLGRNRSNLRYAARTIDIDIIFFNHIILDTLSLTLPHPRMQLRRFVLEPLNEIASGFIHPVFNLTIYSLLQKCEDVLMVKKMSCANSAGDPLVAESALIT